jgi:HSP20 family protein
MSGIVHQMYSNSLIVCGHLLVGWDQKGSSKPCTSILWSILIDLSSSQVRPRDELSFLLNFLSPPIDAPGARDEDVELSVSNGMLGVRVTRQKTVERDIGIHHRTERSFCEMRRTVPIPTNANPDAAVANLNHGVLTISFPKLQQTPTAKKIPLSIQSK